MDAAKKRLLRDAGNSNVVTVATDFLVSFHVNRRVATYLRLPWNQESPGIVERGEQGPPHDNPLAVLLPLIVDIDPITASLAKP